MIELVDEAVRTGARFRPACELLGLSARTVQRWKAEGVRDDRRAGPKTTPGNKLSAAERKRVLDTLNAPEHRDLAPNQIVPLLADQGTYIASESTMYRILREEDMVGHRAAARPATRRAPDEHISTGANQVWSWDITYLRSPIRGSFYYLYVVMDIWSRKIVASAVHEEESADHAAELIRSACANESIAHPGLVLHSDNGSPMKGATMLATLRTLGVAASFSRPRVSNDNPFSESVFRVLKYRPDYPCGAFKSRDAAAAWAAKFVEWYNEGHFHSAIKFVTPSQRHDGEDLEVLENRRAVYAQARKEHPQRWSRQPRDWTPPAEVRLNPSKESELQEGPAA